MLAYPFIAAVRHLFPAHQIHLLCRNNLKELADLFPGVDKVFGFDKKAINGLWKNRKFAVDTFSSEKYSHFFCLPDSFSSAWMGRFVPAKEKIGFSKEGRSFLLSSAFKIPLNLHRSEKHLYLLKQVVDKEILASRLPFLLSNKEERASRENSWVVSLRSVASSRSYSVETAIKLCQEIQKNYDAKLIFTGTKTDYSFYEEVLVGLNVSKGIENWAGKTSLKELVRLLHRSSLFIGVDSGTAHLANACSIPSLVLFGAGNEKETGPFFHAPFKILRKEALDCAPCLSNICQFKTTACLNDLEFSNVVSAIGQLEEEAN